MTDRLRHAADTYPVFMGLVAYEPDTDAEHEMLGWRRSTIEGGTDRVYLRVVGDAIEMWHISETDLPQMLHRWEPGQPEITQPEQP